MSQAKLSRRQFLQGAAVAATAPYIITSTALGAEERAPAGDRITLGHIGIGNQGSGLLGGFLGLRDAQVVAVCDVNAQHRETARGRAESKYKGVAAFNDFRELLARDDIDGVVIAVPDHWHALITIAAAAAGKDIYCEKPLSLTIREARAMVNAVRRYGRVLQVGSMQRSDYKFRYACELVRNGRIGKIQKVNIGLPNNGQSSTEYGLKIVPDSPVPEGFDYDTWLGPAPWRPFNAERTSGNYSGGWRYVRDCSGGMMTDWGAHHFDIAQWGLGMDGSGPVEIHPPDGKDYPTLTYIYNIDGRTIPMMLGDAGKGGVRFTGEHGVVEVNRGILVTTPEVLANTPEDVALAGTDTHLYASRDHHEDFLNCVRTRQKPICDVEIGCRSATVCHLGNIAKWTEQSLKWDPLKEEIIGNEEASRWLDRPKRAPWHLYTT